MDNVSKQIICINWGNKYGADYINRLYAMVARNITPPFTFTCFTDNPQGIRQDVRAEPLPYLSFELPKTQKGIWPKCRLWNKTLADLSGPVLFLDLDVVITGNLDCFFSFGKPDDVILARNPSNPLEKLGQTSIYRFPVGKLVPLLDEFAKAPLDVAETYKYEQRYVTRNAPGGVKFWPKPWVLHFRHHCRPTFPLNYVTQAKCPASSKVVIFPGDLNPTDAIQGRYHSDEPIRTRREHLQLLWKKGRNRSIPAHLRHYILPTDWVANLWKE
ncbi:glycosyl transferase [Paraglaciecola aquimarina]|uniref:Glycosyl transferase n=1 Tax=Paraglaciecola aquimarina TaxID=1235557 RepID=A0ABU3T0X6_9ALTE|nr:glycosyl transferase [Paraglaciecola aquimarina]MDU0355905.1 glycosyl transferase [Paraglaciecola aquimarina]